MAASDHVLLYCERGSDLSLYAEPLNAISNGAFLVAALAALAILLRRPAGFRGADHYLLIFLVFLVGCGSLAFHLFATRSTELADTIPIGIFMLVYLAFALNRLMGVPPGWTMLLSIAFAGLAGLSMQLRCFNGGIGFPGAGVTGTGTCLNGSVGYLPALLAMSIIGALLRERGSAAGRLILWAALLFTISIGFRSADLAFCSSLLIGGRHVGTHFVWHVLNGAVLFLLLLASFETAPAAATSEDEAPSFL